MSANEVQQPRRSNFSSFYKFYTLLNEYILRGLSQMREDFLIFLYFVYIYTFRELYQNSDFEGASAFLLEFKDDFASEKDLADEIEMLHGFCLRKDRNDRVLQDLSASKLIYIQQYSFETMQNYIRRNNLHQIYQFFLNSNKIQIRIIKEPLESLLRDSKENYPQPTRTLLTAETVNAARISQHLGQISITPLKSDLVTMHKIDKNMATMSDATPSKRMNLEDFTHLQYLEDSEVELPKTHLSAKINFYQYYIKREHISVAKEPSALGINFIDTTDMISCIEYSRNFDLLLVGQQNSTILCFVLNPKFLGADFFGYAKKSSAENLKRAMAEETVMKEALESSASYINGQIEPPEAIEFTGHMLAVTSISLQYDQLYFLSASLDFTIRFWGIRERVCLAVFKEHFSTIWEVKFCPKGYFFASGSSDTTARLWATDQSGSCRIFKGHNLDVNVLEFAENCNFLLTGSLDLTVRVWNIQSGECARILYHGSSPVKTIISSLKGGIFVTGSEDGKIVLWDAARGEKKLAFTLKEKKRLQGACLAVDESILCCYTQDVLQYFDVSELLRHRDDHMMTEESKESGEGSLVIEPLNLFQFESREIFTAKFHPQNFLIVATRSQI